MKKKFEITYHHENPDYSSLKFWTSQYLEEKELVEFHGTSWDDARGFAGAHASRKHPRTPITIKEIKSDPVIFNRYKR